MYFYPLRMLTLTQRAFFVDRSCVVKLSGPVANMLAMKYTSRRIVMIGGVLMFLGFILSRFPTQLIYIYFTYGVLIGEFHLQRA